MSRVAAVTIVVVAAGITAGSAPAASRQAVSLTLGYTCAFPSGSQPVSAHVTATFPAAVTAGRPIRPAGAQITVTLPHLAAGDIAPANAATAALTVGLDTEITEGSTSATALWRAFRSPATALPGSGPLTFTTTGAAPPVTAVGGELTIRAAGLSLLLRASPTASSPAASSSPAAISPAAPGSVRAACVPRAGQDTTLARIAVAGSAPATASASPAANPAKCLPFPKNLKLNPLFPLPKPLPGSTVTHLPERGCSYAAGFTNARKLHEAVLVGPGLTDLRLDYKTYLKFPAAYNYLYQQVPAQLEYHGLPELPPIRATLLAFGFTPVSATLQVSEIGSLNAALISCSPNGPKFKCPPQAPDEALFYGLVMLRIYDVDVNGNPLNVGPHCQTASPFDLDLIGLPPTYDVAALNGVLTGTVNVPRFKGCGIGEDLDPIFDATVSGPGNYVEINQAIFCAPSQPKPNGCPPAKPKLIH